MKASFRSGIATGSPRENKLFANNNSSKNNSHVRWKKVLYRKQPFADNHVDETFLRGLKTNVNVVERNYWAMVKSTANITQEILIVLIFCVVFKFTHDVSCLLYTSPSPRDNR